jgi:hypothetical protein
MLIQEVRQYQELYDMMHKKYSDNIHKDNVWGKNHNFFLRRPKLRQSSPVIFY